MEAPTLTLESPDPQDADDYQWPWWAGLAALGVPAVLLGLTLLQGGRGDAPQGWPRWTAAAVVLLPWIVDLPLRRVPCWLYAVAAWVPIAVLGHHYSAGAAWFLLVYLVGQTATMGHPRTSVPVFVAAQATILVEALSTPAPYRVDDWTGWFLGLAAAFVGGMIWRRQHALVVELSAAQRGLAERATLAERQRIAGEVHDVVAHSLTVTLLHLTGARMALRSGAPGEAAEALAEAERVGRQSLDDVRRTVGLLAPAGAGGTAPPLPGLDDLDHLVGGYADAGVDVRLDVAGEPGRVSAATGLCLYRIVQESLANASRHAPGSSVEVRLRIDPTTATLRVRNSPGATPVGAAGANGGRGIPGMRQRIAALSGGLWAGADGDGWLVEATVPLSGPAG